jgi:hypothetical protein
MGYHKLALSILIISDLSSNMLDFGWEIKNERPLYALR